jgi:hypothetical protein
MDGQKHGWEWVLEKRYAVQAGWHQPHHLDAVRPNPKSRWRTYSTMWGCAHGEHGRIVIFSVLTEYVRGRLKKNKQRAKRVKTDSIQTASAGQAGKVVFFLVDNLSQSWESVCLDDFAISQIELF